MSVHPRDVHKRRATITALPLYYSGHLLKKDKQKDFKKCYAELRGATLFLYNDDTQDTYTEKLDLEKMKSIKIDSPYLRKVPMIFTLKLLTGKVQLKVEQPDAGDEWKRYILTVKKKEIPSKLQLLPGQILQLQEVLDQERRRSLPIMLPPLPPKPTTLLPASPSPSSPPPRYVPDGTTEAPECFFNVTRQEAEQMLEANPEYGSMILRPSTLSNSYAVTLRLLMPRGPAMKNFRVTATNSGFVIEVDPPVTVPSLNDVLEYFLEMTEYRLRPYSSSQLYDTRIGETNAAVTSSLELSDRNTNSCSLLEDIGFISPPSKTPPKAQVAPMLRSEAKEELPPEEDEYEVPDDHCPDDPKLKLALLGGELQEVLKKRRDDIYTAAASEEASTYENSTSELSKVSTAQWSTKSLYEFDC